MGNTVILAEKPSVARDIARVLGCRRQGDGYVAGDGVVVTWAVGHLVGLAQPHEINPVWKSWDLGFLPMLPREWKLSVLATTKDQFEIVRKLISAAETDEVVCATDAGREGELIFRNIYEAAGCQKRVRRLWISSLTEDAIRDGFRGLRPGGDYDALAAAARARAQADWLVGLNLTRAYSPRGAVVSVGRVQTPTLAMIVERDGTIDHFIAEPYCEVEATFAMPSGGKYVGKLVRRDAVEGVLRGGDGQASETANAFRHPVSVQLDPAWERSGAIVERRDEHKHREGAPLLYDLTDLQRHANRVFGMSAQQTLEAAQSLYEKKLLTYPRTDCRYVPADVAVGLSRLGTAAERRYADCVREGTCGRELPKRFVNDAKITDHHAILPASCGAEGARTSDEEARIYDLVCRRLVSCWLPDYVSAVTTVLTWTLATGGKDLWVSKGTVVLEQGWKILEPAVRKDGDARESDSGTGALPGGLARGVQSRVESVAILKKKSRPPARFTEASLLTAMESAGKTLEEAELSEAMRERGLGTPATRAAIIELLVARGYIERRNKQLHSTQLGRDLIAAVAPELRSAELTGRWEAYLKHIERGGGSVERFLGSIAAFVTEVVKSVKTQGATPIRVPVDAGRRPSTGEKSRRRGRKSGSGGSR
jgi:DNA topoisomerase-3